MGSLTPAFQSSGSLVDFFLPPSIPIPSSNSQTQQEDAESPSIIVHPPLDTQISMKIIRANPPSFVPDLITEKLLAFVPVLLV